MWFASDNTAAPAPEVMRALAAAATGFAAPYGDDEATARAAALIRETFEAPEAAVHFVATGTAANSLSLACLCPPWAGIFCHKAAHIRVDECHAPEFYTGGARLVLAGGENGRMTPETLEAAIADTHEEDVHMTQRGALSLTNATEAGTVYDPAAIAALTARAREIGVGVHVDGTRFANAVAALGCSPAELSWKAGVDILCLGATKNGGMAAEAVILFDPARAREFELRRKRGGHLFSKMRYLAAQFEAMMTDGLWLSLAGHSNALAARLAEGLRANPEARLVHPVEANICFVEFPRAIHRAAKGRGAVYGLWGDLDGPDDERLMCRLVCSSQTTEEDVDRLLAALRG